MFAIQEVSRLCVNLSVNVQRLRLACNWHVTLLSGVLQRKALCDPCAKSCIGEVQTVHYAPKTCTNNTCVCHKDIDAVMGV